METRNLVLYSFLALGIGFMVQQSAETLINTSLVLLPFNINTTE